jgi:glucose-1-phosphate thymidylyltransferase
VEKSRLQFEFAVQDEPRGTADAVLAAAEFTARDSFLVINSDNCYPTSALHALRMAEGCAVAGFDRQAMVEGGNVSADRLDRFGLLQVDEAGLLRCVVEKPSASLLETTPEPVLISMNCWRFGAEILEACAKISPSPRGELEIPDAVMYTMRELGQRYQVIQNEEAVLDLSSRADIESVTQRLAGTEVHL